MLQPVYEIISSKIAKEHKDEFAPDSCESMKKKITYLFGSLDFSPNEGWTQPDFSLIEFLNDRIKKRGR